MAEPNRHQSRFSTVVRRGGFTLIEVLVAIGIIGLLVGLLLPAVQSARESARRLTCITNLKQIGLSLQSYASLYQYFPGINTPTRFRAGGPISGHAYSPLARILGELDQVPLYNATNFSDLSTSPGSLWANQTVMMTTLAVFVCPSDVTPPVSGYGRVSYRFNLGPGPWYAPGRDKQSSWDGPFSSHRFYSPADFPDGLSQTIGVSERLQGNWMEGTWSPGNYLLTDAGSRLKIGQGPYTIDEMTSACDSASLSLSIETRSGESWFLSGLHFTDYNHCAVPNAKTHDCSLYAIWSGSLHDRTLHEGVFTARSRHPGGVNALRMDGSVRFVSDSIDKQTWRGFSTRAGREVGGDDL